MKIPIFVFSIIALILGVAIFKNFDFENMTFAKPALNAIYLLAFALSISLVAKSYKKLPKNK